jgi:hypothetical protein
MVRLFGAPSDVGARTEWAYQHRTRASVANALLLAPFFAVLLLVTGQGWAATSIAFVIFAVFFFVWIWVAMWRRGRSYGETATRTPRFGTKAWHKVGVGIIALFVMWIAVAIVGALLSR